MSIQTIRNDDEQKAALRELSAFFDNEPDPGTEAGNRFEVVLTLVEAFEAKRFAIETPPRSTRSDFARSKADLRQ